MPSPFDAAVSAAFNALRTAKGVVVTIFKSGGTGKTCSVVDARTTEHELGFLTRDFVIPVGAVAFAGQPWRPAPGDVILADSIRYEVRPFENETAFRWSDPRHQEMRVHAKEAYLPEMGAPHGTESARCWNRDVIRIESYEVAPGAGQAQRKDDGFSRCRGLVKVVSGMESLAHEMQRVEYVEAMMIVPFCATFRGLDSGAKVTVETACGTTPKDWEVLSVRDPGTRESVLYLECRSQRKG